MSKRVFPHRCKNFSINAHKTLHFCHFLFKGIFDLWLCCCNSPVPDINTFLTCCKSESLWRDWEYGVWVAIIHLDGAQCPRRPCKGEGREGIPTYLTRGEDGCVGQGNVWGGQRWDSSFSDLWTERQKEVKTIPSILLRIVMSSSPLHLSSKTQHLLSHHWRCDDVVQTHNDRI